MSLKRNEFLDTGISDDEDGSEHDSDAAEDIRGSRISVLKARSSKRQKLSTQDDDSNDEDISDGTPELENHSNAPTGLQPPSTKSSNHNAQTPKDSTSVDPQNPTPTPKTKVPTPTQLAKTQRLALKTGVIYLSRIPPFMRPSTLRHLLSPHGHITRLFLTPEPSTTHTLRLQSGGNKKRSFVDGWVEFASKRSAKICAETINGRIVGGKKGGWYHDDLWNVKYLRGFKWGDLMEGVRREERGREERMRVEVRREGRERRAFLEGVERGKREVGMERKRKRRAEERGDGVQAATEGGEKGGKEIQAGAENGNGKEEKEPKKKRFERHFRQNEVKKKSTKGSAVADQPDEVKRVLSKIF